MSLGSESLDDLEGEEAHRAQRSAVLGVVAMPVTLEAQSPDARAIDGALGHTTIRDADLEHTA
jgi:hypothetical protein